MRKRVIPERQRGLAPLVSRRAVLDELGVNPYAGVPLETRKVLLKHKAGDITSHDSSPDLAELYAPQTRC